MKQTQVAQSDTKAQRVQCEEEEEEEEEDLTAIRGVHWCEKDQPADIFLLEKIGDAPVMSSHSIWTNDEEALPYLDGNDMDAGSESDNENEAGPDNGIDQNEVDADDGINQNKADTDNGVMNWGGVTNDKKSEAWEYKEDFQV
ncbi:hypothetical protein BDR07DRAFT_1489681 [Suillus spraguei]|nr:hypothetical protein BDR07DRAFT_1489681 [Suillus spraguei]